MTMKEKRDKIKAYLKKVFDTIEDIPNSQNGERYINMIDGMTDAQFTAFMTRLKNKEEQLFIYTPNLKNKITNRTILAGAKLVKTKLFDRVYMVDQVTGKRYLTPNEHMIINLPIRRVKQFLMDKISLPESDKKIDLLTGQVIKPDKGSSISLIEAQLIMDKGLDKPALELLKVRGGDIHSYAEFSNRISETGEVDLSALDLSSVPRSAMIASIYLKAMHIGNNLVE